MSLDPEDDLDAAEYALGTLDPGERAALAARRLREPELAVAIAAWERRLAPLAEATPPIAPAVDPFAAIEARIRGAAPPKAPGRAPVAIETRLRRWRAAALAASSACVLLIAGFLAHELTREAAPHAFVAVLQRSPESPAFALSVNIDTREFTVRPVSAPAPAGKSYELWLIAPKLGAPRSLGLIDASAATHAGRLGAYDRTTVEDATYAVTLEPPGGSPTGEPSGPPVFVGKLIAVEP